MTSNLSVVTGANRGIGLALCRLLKQRGGDVLGACRTASTVLSEAGVEVVEGVDVATEAGIERLVASVGQRDISLLINNAGILIGDNLEQLDFEAVSRQFEVNAVGPVRVTQALRKRLKPGAKVAMVTSRMGSIADNISGRMYGYRMSKAALNIASMSLARDLADAQVPVAILHPGLVKTDMVGSRGQVEPEDSARGLIDRIDALTLSTSGSFWHANGEQLPW